MVSWRFCNVFLGENLDNAEVEENGEADNVPFRIVPPDDTREVEAFPETDTAETHLVEEVPSDSESSDDEDDADEAPTQRKRKPKASSSSKSTTKKANGAKKQRKQGMCIAV